MNSRILSIPTRLINKDGREITYKKLVDGSYNIETGTYSENSITSTQVKAYKTNSSFRDSQSPSLIGKTLASYYISAQEFNIIPDTGDVIVDENKEYQVVLVRSHMARGVVAYWTITVVCS